MKSPQRHGVSSTKFILITLAAIFTVFGLCILLVCSVIGGSGESIESTQRRLLYATNPALLMEACRQMESAGGTSTQPVYPDPTSALLPPIIRRVRPRTITIDRHRVTLECGSNVYRFGVVVDTDALPTTMPTTRPDPPMATRKLAPGVWYYAEDKAVPIP